jgi:hypothetical protein
MTTRTRNALALAWNLTAVVLCCCCPILVLVLGPARYRD